MAEDDLPLVDEWDDDPSLREVILFGDEEPDDYIAEDTEE